MNRLSTLTEVTRELEQDENLLGIKKLIVCVCRDIWENDANELGSLSLQELIEELCQVYPNLEQLRTKLDWVVKSLNKPKKYAAVAEKILSNVGNLYPDAEESTQLLVTQTAAVNYSVPTPEKQHVQPVAYTVSDTRRAYEPFDLRQEVMKYTNPLRAKILIFSTIEQKFTFNKEDWLTIKSKELDDLLLRLFQECSTIAKLEYELCETAKELKNPEESNQAAGAIIQALRPFYSQGQGLWNQTRARNSNMAGSNILMLNSKSVPGQMSGTVRDDEETGTISATVRDDEGTGIMPATVMDEIDDLDNDRTCDVLQY